MATQPLKIFPFNPFYFCKVGSIAPSFVPDVSNLSLQSLFCQLCWCSQRTGLGFCLFSSTIFSILRRIYFHSSQNSLFPSACSTFSLLSLFYSLKVEAEVINRKSFLTFVFMATDFPLSTT